MKFKYFLSSVLSILLLTACNNKSDSYSDTKYDQNQ